MKKRFISESNFKYTWEYIKYLLSNKQDRLPEGSIGQILKKVDNGVEWSDDCEELEMEDIKDIFFTFEEVEPSKARTLDVVFANKNTGKVVIARKWNTNMYPPEIYVPIGLVVIPGEHGVLKNEGELTNHCGVMSLVDMYSTHPETGKPQDEQNLVYQRLPFGGASSPATVHVEKDLKQYPLINFVGDEGVVTQTLKGTVNTAYLPSDNFNTIKNPFYDKTSYFYNDDKYYAPCPYLTDRSYNSIYGQITSPSTEENSLSDFNGIKNTKLITNLATGQKEWKTQGSIENIGGVGYYPAACCCARYKTIGTKAFVDCNEDELKAGTGFWYFPAMGELGYVVIRFKEINDTITELINLYGVGSKILEEFIYSSSTKYDEDSINGLDMSDGQIKSFGRTNLGFIRAFLRL